MLKQLAARLRRPGPAGLQRRIILVYLFLLALNLAAWALALAVFHSCVVALGWCFAAYGFGLQHAVDADHLAAIDNVTRKLMQENKRPVAVGLFFSLGHSTVVVLLSLLVAQGTGYMRSHYPEFQGLYGLIGTGVSASFLLLMALVNFVIFLAVLRRFRAARQGNGRHEDALHDILGGPGLIARTLRSLFKLIGASWQMYFVGFLFGLGFDTATQIAVYGITATLAAQQASLWSIMIFPLLFTSGMCLVDASDGIVMLGAYGWAFIKPVRKLFYNMTITMVSFVIAFLIGGLEVLSVIAEKFHLESGVWAVVKTLSDNSTATGFAIIGLMLACWLASLVAYRLAGLDRLDEPAGPDCP